VKILREVSEAEVISEFLRAEFFHPEYDRDRDSFEHVVYEPDLQQPGENALRRALLFRRRGHLWRELPPDTIWCELQLNPEEADLVNVFPRAQWRSPAHGNFAASNVAQQIRLDMLSEKPSALAVKIKSLTALLQLQASKSTVLLIGLDELRPLTLLEGNHRFIAGMMLPRELMLERLRLVCGFSPRMEECCWYKTNLPTLSHYLKNRIKYFWDREADVYRLLMESNGATRKSSQGDKLSATVNAHTVNSK
jgi:hypothetical protein